MKYEVEGKVALVTGASRGLGEQISLELIKRGTFVVGTSRSGAPESLKPFIKEGKADYISADLVCENENVIRHVCEKYHGFEMLVNNAGALSVDCLPLTSPEKIVQEINIDLIVPMLLHHRWLSFSRMEIAKVRKPECSVNICSISSFYAWAGGSEYQAAKTGVAAFIQGLRAMQRFLGETTDDKVKARLGQLTKIKTRFLNIYPDSIDTGMISKAEEDSLYKIRGDLLPQDLVVQVIMDSIVGKKDYGNYDDIAILANPTDPKNNRSLDGIYVGFLPIDKETQRADFNSRILSKISGPEMLIKRGR